MSEQIHKRRKRYKGTHPRNFEEKYKDSGFNMKATNEKHIQNEKPGSITTVRDEETSMNENGNNVNLDLEKVNQAANTLMYQALTSRASGKLASMKTVIGGN